MTYAQPTSCVAHLPLDQTSWWCSLSLFYWWFILLVEIVQVANIYASKILRMKSLVVKECICWRRCPGCSFILRLINYTFSDNRLGRNAEEADAEEIIDMANKASLADQQKQVQETVHSQVTIFCGYMDGILLPDRSVKEDQVTSLTAVPETNALQRIEVSQRLKDLMGYTPEVKRSQIPHEDTGQGLFLHGEANIGSVIAFYPGVVYSPSYYRYIPGYPRIDSQNSHLITWYDGTAINAQSCATGGQPCEIWDLTHFPEAKHTMQGDEKGSGLVSGMLNKPLDGRHVGGNLEVLERRNPLAFAHFANHPAKGMVPNVMLCPYDFPLVEKDIRPHTPNISFGSAEEANMERFGSSWFKSWQSSNDVSDVRVLKTLVLVAIRAMCDEEVLLNYRLSNSEHIPSWYIPVDEEEDQRS